MYPSAAPTSVYDGITAMHKCFKQSAKPDPNIHPQDTALERRKLSANPTSSTPPSTPTSVIQKYVTNAEEIVSSHPAIWRMFLTETSDI